MNITKRAHLAKGGDQSWSILDNLLDSIYQAINSIDIGDIEDGAPAANINGRWLVYTTNAVANTDDVKRHRLGRTPKTFLQFERPNKTGETPNAGQLYWGTGPSATDDKVTLRCTTASKQVYVLLF